MSNYIFIELTHQAWILTPYFGQCPAKNRVMFGESCFTTDAIKFFFITYQCLKTQKHAVSIGLHWSGFSGVSA